MHTPSGQWQLTLRRCMKLHQGVKPSSPSPSSSHTHLSEFVMSSPWVAQALKPSSLRWRHISSETFRMCPKSHSYQEWELETEFRLPNLHLGFSFWRPWGLFVRLRGEDLGASGTHSPIYCWVTSGNYATSPTMGKCLVSAWCKLTITICKGRRQD